MVETAKHFHTAVIGAGPSGLAMVGKLLDLKVSSILWIDSQFGAGRLSTYVDVPSNTKVKLFTAYATHYDSFKAVWGDSSLKSLDELRKLDPEKGCKLRYAADMVRDLVTGLLASSKASSHFKMLEGTVESLSYEAKTWTIQTGKNESFTCQNVVLATGSHPRGFIFEDATKAVCLDDVLQPEMMRTLVEKDDTVAVLGSSHSAMLAIKILSESDVRPKKVVNFYRSPLKFAEYLEDGRIKRDNTGLKGEVADWVRGGITDCDGQLRAVQLGGFLERVCLEGDEPAIYAEHLPECTKIVSAIGYERNALPEIHVDGGAVADVSYSNEGQLFDGSNGSRIPGLFGVGIAFPARVIDVDGSPELAVGLWKFIKHTATVAGALITSSKHSAT